MLSNEVLKARLEAIECVEHVEVTGDGYHYNITIVSDSFIDKSKLARQQWVYGHLKMDIMTGDLHALSMETLTKHEWEKKYG